MVRFKASEHIAMTGQLLETNFRPKHRMTMIIGLLLCVPVSACATEPKAKDPEEQKTERCLSIVGVKVCPFFDPRTKDEKLKFKADSRESKNEEPKEEE